MREDCDRFRLRERVWRAVAHGNREIRDIASRLNVSSATIREIILDACIELVARIDREKRHARIDELRDRE